MPKDETTSMKREDLETASFVGGHGKPGLRRWRRPCWTARFKALSASWARQREDRSQLTISRVQHRCRTQLVAMNTEASYDCR